MHSKMRLHAIAAFYLAALLTGCATTQGIPQKIGAVANGTLVVAEVSNIFTRDEILNPKDPYSRGWHKKLREAGFEDKDIVDGSDIGSFTSCYAHNSMVGCTHPSIYLAHVPPELRGKLVPAKPLEKAEEKKQGDVTVTKLKDSGDLVKIELRITPSGNVIGIVKEVYRKHDNWGDCSFKPLGYRGLSVVHPLGPPQGVSIDCPGLEQEGWSRYRIPASPPPGTFEWRKEPSPPTKQ